MSWREFDGTDYFWSLQLVSDGSAVFVAATKENGDDSGAVFHIQVCGGP
jgi:hypothetical protein